MIIYLENMRDQMYKLFSKVRLRGYMASKHREIGKAGLTGGRRNAKECFWARLVYEPIPDSGLED